MKTWTEKRQYLIDLIKRVSDKYGGDKEDFLKEYSLEVVNKYAMDLDTAIACFESLL